MKTRTLGRLALRITPIYLAAWGAGCGDDNPMSPEEADMSTFEGVVASGGLYEKVTPSDEIVSSVTGQETGADGTVYVCRTERRSTVNAPDDYATFDPNAEVIYPGSMLQGKSLGGATPEPIVVQRAGGTITINLVNGSTVVSSDVPEVKQSTVVQAMNDVLAQNSGQVPAAFTFNFTEVQSQRQMALNMGVNFNSLTTNVKSRLSFSQDKSYNRFLVELNQRYYTMSFDLPVSVGELFHESVTPQDLAKYVGAGNPATYISSVTYGRRFYLLVESTASHEEIRASIDASYSAALAGGSGNMNGTYVKDLTDARVKVFALGGDASHALATFNGDIDQVANFLTQGGSITTGVPLSYVVRNVHDNSIVNIKVATEYDLKSCEVLAAGSYLADFETGTQGWSGYADFKNLRVLSGGFSGQFLRADDRGDGRTWYFRAPISWAGDWSHFYGGQITMYLWIGGSGSYFTRDDVVIYSKSGERLAGRFSGYPNKNGFFRFTLKLDESTLRYNNRAATRDEVIAALSDVSDVFLRGEYLDGADWGAIDEIQVTGPPPGA